ncbi:sensor histidine kinase [Gluconacetobacter sacchari]|uniref:histidine kinase n=2 Tax=Gluconacetobacter sacchari TaxID=92759 RepID=A0A7W4IEJ8_9PROT|nr:HAMP domain-containing sensor histidine kinase [Gluconacetobacter sacchari]MBB2161423.1 HAMP domain-containing histidine kinase [Gluconacetobacter sacchari]
MRVIRSFVLCIVLVAAACLLAPRALAAGFYASTALLVLVACAAILAHLGTLTSLLRRPVRVETAIVRPADRERLRNRALLDHAPIPLLYRTGDGVLHAANRAARRLFATEDRLPAAAATLLGTLSPERRVLRMPTVPEAPPRTFALAVAQGGGAGGVTHFLALTDIEAELNAADARTLRDLLQILGHEIMNSLTPIVSLAETAHEITEHPLDPAAAETIREALATILRRTRGLDRFVQGYRDLARLPPPDPRPTDLHDLLRALGTLFDARWTGRVQLETTLPPQRVIVRLDAAQMEQALLNLLNNAAEAALAATGDATAPDPTVWLQGHATSTGMLIAVRDNGPGIPDAYREAIFRPFFSLKPDGSGIGLSLARQIALAHGGSLTLEPARPDTRWRTAFLLSL